MKKFADRHRSQAPNHKTNDFAWLRSSYVPLRFGKLDDKYVGPFKIAQVISENAVILDLPFHWKVHPTFNVSALKKYFPLRPFPKYFTFRTSVCAP